MIRISSDIPNACDLYNAPSEPVISYEEAFNKIYKSFVRDYDNIFSDFLDDIQKGDLSSFSNKGLLIPEGLYYYQTEYNDKKALIYNRSNHSNRFIRLQLFNIHCNEASSNHEEKAAVFISKSFNMSTVRPDTKVNTFLSVMLNNKYMKDSSYQRFFLYAFIQKYIEYKLIADYGFSYAKEGIIVIKDTIDAPYFVYLYFQTYAMIYSFIFGTDAINKARCAELLHLTNYGYFYNNELYSLKHVFTTIDDMILNIEENITDIIIKNITDIVDVKNAPIKYFDNHDCKMIKEEYMKIVDIAIKHFKDDAYLEDDEDIYHFCNFIFNLDTDLRRHDTI